MLNKRAVEHRLDVCIFGGGIAGLFLAERLISLGYKVAVIEKDRRLASGASSRNEGWLHHGTYHCGSIQDPALAVQVARRCIYGYESIRIYAPESIENPDLPSYALVKDENIIHRLLNCWDEAKVPYREVSKIHVANFIPKVEVNSFSKAFQVKDVSINTRILYKKLSHDISRKGGLIISNVEARFLDENSQVCISNQDGYEALIHASLYVHATGYWTKKIFENQFNINLPIRLWRSHLLVLPKLSDYVCFFLDPDKVTIMRHGNNSVVGLNEDAQLYNGSDLEQFDQDEVSRILEALRKCCDLQGIDSYSVTSCIKVDVPENPENYRSLDVSIIKVLSNHVCIFPGKMTTAPFLADKMVKYIYELLDDNSTISYRPWDSITSWNLEST
jgi:glycerol-3-phosphate dehydrogenase